MLAKQDLNKIKGIFEKEGKKLFEKEGKKLFEKEGKKLEKRILGGVSEMIEGNIMPALDNHAQRLEKIEKKINTLPDKLYLSDKFADIEANVTSRQRKEDEKVNLLIGFLKKKKVLVKNEVELLEQIEVFVRPHAN